MFYVTSRQFASFVITSSSLFLRVFKVTSIFHDQPCMLNVAYNCCCMVLFLDFLYISFTLLRVDSWPYCKMLNLVYTPVFSLLKCEPFLTGVFFHGGEDITRPQYLKKFHNKSNNLFVTAESWLKCRILLNEEYEKHFANNSGCQRMSQKIILITYCQNSVTGWRVGWRPSNSVVSWFSF